MATSALELIDVAVTFQADTLLRDVNLSIAPEECVVLMGPSGHGKSVLLKLFAGLLKPSAGRVLVEGQDLHAISDEKRMELLLKMGMLFQRNALFDSLPVGENIAFPLRETTSLPASEINTRVENYLSAVGLAAAKDLYPSEISGGMQKRLGIARALALEPDIVLYDDPTAGLDPITSRKIADLILELKNKNHSTAVVVTNDMARAFQMADRLVMVVDGSVIVTGNKEQTLHHKNRSVHQFVRGELSGPLTAES